MTKRYLGHVVNTCLKKLGYKVTRTCTFPTKTYIAQDKKQENAIPEANVIISRYGERGQQLNSREQCILHHITTVLDRLEDAVGVVYDIGANKGRWAEAFALYTGASVYAFEPLPAMIRELQMRQQRCHQIKIQAVACGNKCLRTIMFEDENKVEASSILKMADVSKIEFSQSKLGHSHEENIEIVRLDDWVDEKKLPLPTLIKVDVQGYENQIIEGGLETLKKTKYIWIELCFKQLYVEGSTFETVYAALSRLGFQLIDCIELVRSTRNAQLIYMDGLFINTNLK